MKFDFLTPKDSLLHLNNLLVISISAFRISTASLMFSPDIIILVSLTVKVNCGYIFGYACVL